MYEDKSILERFFEKVDLSGPSENKIGTPCWLWTGSKTIDGYGSILFRGVSEGVHRVSWQLAYGPIPETNDAYGTMLVCHHCDNPPCIRPSHLFIGTQKDNIIDMISKGRNSYQKGEQNSQAKLTWEKVREMRRMYANGEGTKKEIGERYGIKKSHAAAIINNKYWVENS